MIFSREDLTQKYKILQLVSLFLLILIGVLIVLLWFSYFSLASSFDLGSVFFKSLYFILVASSVFIVLKVDIKVLTLGWFLLVYAFLINLLTSLTNPPALWGVYIVGEMTTLSLLLVIIGAYLAIKRYKKSEDKIRKSEQKYRLIFNSSPEVIVLLDRKGNFVTANQRFEDWLGYKVKDFQGKNIKKFSFLTPGSKKKALRKFSSRLKGESITAYEIEFTRRGGKKLFGRLSASVIKNKKGKIVGDLVMVSDITRRKKAEEKVKDLKELDRIKDEFLNVAAHEFKSPLASIIGMGQILEQGEENLSEEQKGYLKVIVKESLRLNWVVKQILTVTRLETDKAVIKKEVFDLGGLIKSLEGSLETLAKKNKSKIKIIEENDNLEVTGDKSRISGVMYNLVENAVKYGKEGQTITIRMVREAGKAKVEVVDEGGGIPQELQDKIFVKFGQLENYLRRAHEGIGLGLYICKIVIKKMGGQIGFKNNKKQGANFYFTLPLKK